MSIEVHISWHYNNRAVIVTMLGWMNVCGVSEYSYVK